VNNHLAHLEPTADVSIPTVIDIDRATELLGTLRHRYLLLMTGSGLKITSILQFDWTAVFRQSRQEPSET